MSRNRDSIAKEAVRKERNASLDVLRVLAMGMIVVGHCLLHGGVLEAAAGSLSTNYILTQTLYCMLRVHVNCFVLVSGYFLCTSTFRLSKWLKLWGTAFFWSLLIFALLCMTGNAAFSLVGLVKAFLPFSQQRYWFLTTYLLMYMLSPVCNAAIEKMTQKQHLMSLLGFFAVYICYQNLIFWREFTAMNPRDPLFFLFLYFVAAYIRKYPFRKKHPWLLGYLICVGFVAAWTIFEPVICTKLIGFEIGYTAFAGYHSIPYVLGSICFFMVFVQADIKGWIAKLAVALSPLTFGVYLIHDHPEMRTFLWQTLLRPYRFADSPVIIPIVLAISVSVFAACALCEKLRIIVFVKLKIDCIFREIAKSIQKVSERFISIQK